LSDKEKGKRPGREGRLNKQVSAFSEFMRSTWGKVLTVLAVITVLLGVVTEGVTLYGQSQVAEVKAEIARNADKRQEAEKDIAAQKARIETQAAENAKVLEQAKAAKAKADADVAQAMADNAAVKQAAERQFASARAISEAAIAKYAARTKRAEADKQAAEAVTAQEVAKNSAVKFQAEAEKTNLQSLVDEHTANMIQWINNCAASTGSTRDCATKWGCISYPSGISCQ
jgi:hypothetical protein